MMPLMSGECVEVGRLDIEEGLRALMLSQPLNPFVKLAWKPTRHSQAVMLEQVSRQSEALVVIAQEIAEVCCQWEELKALAEDIPNGAAAAV